MTSLGQYIYQPGWKDPPKAAPAAPAASGDDAWKSDWSWKRGGSGMGWYHNTSGVWGGVETKPWDHRDARPNSAGATYDPKPAQTQTSARLAVAGKTPGMVAPPQRSQPQPAAAPVAAPAQPAAPPAAPPATAPGVTVFNERQAEGSGYTPDTTALANSFLNPYGVTYDPSSGSTAAATPTVDGTMGALANTSGLEVPKKIAEDGMARPLDADPIFKETDEEFQGDGIGQTTGTKNVEELNQPTEPEAAPDDPDLNVDGLKKGSTPINDTLPALSANYGQIDNAEAYYDQYGNLLTRPGYTEGLADLWDPNRLTYSEQFLLGDGQEGIQAMFDRLREQGRRAIDDRAAAAGTFNSGAALRGYSELEADLAAQQVQKLMELSGQSDEARVRNAAEGRQLMMGADSGRVDRLMAGGGLARGADQSAASRAEGMTGLYDAASGRFLEAKDLARQFGVDAGDFRLRRIGQQFDTASRTQELGENRATRRLDNAIKVDTLRMDKDKTYADISLAIEDAGLRRTSTLIDALLKNKQLDNQQAIDLKKFSLDLKRFGLEKDQVDAIIAKTLQDMEIDWKKLPVEIWTTLGKSMSDSASPFLLGGAEDQIDAGMKGIETQILTAGLDREAAYAKADALMKSLYGSVDPIMKALVQKRIDDAIAKRGAA